MCRGDCVLVVVLVGVGVSAVASVSVGVSVDVWGRSMGVCRVGVRCVGDRPRRVV